jgi:hypothetical protein
LDTHYSEDFENEWDKLKYSQFPVKTFFL